MAGGGAAWSHLPGTALLDDVTLSNAGLREDTTVIVAAVTVYGARSVTVTGSNLATRSISSATLRQALLGKVMTVGDTVSLLPRRARTRHSDIGGHPLRWRRPLASPGPPSC